MWQLLWTRWMCRGRAELALPLTGWCALKSWHHLSEVALGPAPHPDSTVMEVWINSPPPPCQECVRTDPGVMRVGELALHLTCAAQ